MGVQGEGGTTSAPLGVGLVAGAVLLWSTIAVTTRIVQADMGAILFWHGLAGGLSLLVLQTVQSGGGLAWAARGRRRTLRVVASLSFGHTTLYIAALMHTTVAHVVAIYGTLPLLAMVLECAVCGKALRARSILCATLACMGILLVTKTTGAVASLAGDVMAFGSTLSMAFLLLILKDAPGGTLTGPLGLGALASAAFGFLVGAPLAASGRDIAILFGMGLFQCGGGDGLFVLGARLIGAGSSAMIGALEAPLAATWSWLAGVELLEGSTLLGSAMVMVAVLLHLGQRAPAGVALGRKPG